VILAHPKHLAVESQSCSILFTQPPSRERLAGAGHLVWQWPPPRPPSLGSTGTGLKGGERGPDSRGRGTDQSPLGMDWLFASICSSPVSVHLPCQGPNPVGRQPNRAHGATKPASSPVAVVALPQGTVDARRGKGASRWSGPARGAPAVALSRR
jgi:hypothetical protein